MITVAKTAELVKKFGKTEKDSGAPEVQVAILTERINNLMGHFKDHKHDNQSNRGLLKMIGSRKSLLKYLARIDADRYSKLIKELGLRK
jgi:small subunit ribosomal protein S15